MSYYTCKYKFNLVLFFYYFLSRYETRHEAEHCINIMQNTVLEGNTLFIGWDAGFIEGRQFKRCYRNIKKSLNNYPFSNRIVFGSK